MARTRRKFCVVTKSHRDLPGLLWEATLSLPAAPTWGKDRLCSAPAARSFRQRALAPVQPSASQCPWSCIIPVTVGK